MWSGIHSSTTVRQDADDSFVCCLPTADVAGLVNYGVTASRGNDEGLKCRVRIYECTVIHRVKHNKDVLPLEPALVYCFSCKLSAVD